MGSRANTTANPNPEETQSQTPETSTEKKNFLSVFATKKVDEPTQVNVLDMAESLRDEEIISIVLNVGEFTTNGAELRNRKTQQSYDEEQAQQGNAPAAPRTLTVKDGCVIFKVTKRPTKRPGSPHYLAAAVEVHGYDKDDNLKTAGYIGIGVDAITKGFTASLRDQNSQTYKRIPDQALQALIAMVPPILVQLTNNDEKLQEIHNLLWEESVKSAAMRAHADATKAQAAPKPMAPKTPKINEEAANNALDDI